MRMHLLVKSRKINFPSPQLFRLIAFLAEKMEWPKEESFSLVLCGDRFIRNLNRDFRNIDSATDVLSFEDDQEDSYRGDIVISLNSAVKNSIRFKVPYPQEFLRLVTHGLLHLHGFDHEGTEGGEMLTLQERLLKEFFTKERL